MRRVLIPSLLMLIVIAVALGIGQASSWAAAPAQQFRQVNISITCDAGQVDDVNVRPWTARASRSGTQQLRWRLLPNSDVASATVQPKDRSSWPFDSQPPLTVNRGAAADSGAITGANGSYFYDIIVDCGGGATVIDPRMDIDP